MTLEEINKTHDWDTNNELWICKKCGKNPIELHIWGDDQWTKTAQSCEGVNS